MQIITVIIFGFLVGIIARMIMPGRTTVKGFILTTLLGICGALTGKFSGEALGLYKPDEPAGFVMSVIGAMLILFLFHMLNSSKSDSSK